MDLLIYMVAAFGLAFIVGRAKISFPIRLGLNLIGSWRNPIWRPLKWFVILIECPACLGFWIGFVSAYRFDVSLIGLDAFSSAMIVGCFTSGSNLLFYALARSVME